MPRYFTHSCLEYICPPKDKDKEAHASTYAMIKLKGDAVANHAIESRLEREANGLRNTLQ